MKVGNNVKHVPGAYMIIDKANEKAYIGSTGNLRERAMNHRSYLKNGKHPNKVLQEHYDKCNGELDFVSIEMTDKSIALELEQGLLDIFHNGGVLCNRSDDALLAGKANKGYRQSEEHTRKKAEYMHNRPITDEFRQNMSIAAKLRGISPVTRQRCLEAHCKKVSVDGVIYSSIKEAALGVGVNYDSAKRRLHSPNFPNYEFL